jgi:putative peptide zinc metalloprotease protein
MSRRRRLCALLLSLAAACAPAAPALAQDNAAVAVNTKDGSSVFKLAFSIKKTLQPVVESQNAAVAYSSCENCQTVAIAIEVVLIMGDATTVSPENVAIAINENCTACETLASAYQFVLGTGGVVRLTKEGRMQINAIRKALRELGKGGLSIEEIQARVAVLYGRLKQVFTTQLELVEPKDIAGETDGDGQDGGGSAEPDASDTPQAGTTPDATQTPTPTPSPEATPTPTATPTTSPAPSATPTATAQTTP